MVEKRLTSLPPVVEIVAVSDCNQKYEHISSELFFLRTDSLTFLPCGIIFAAAGHSRLASYGSDGYVIVHP